MVSEWEMLLRLTLSCILGGIIGYERQSRRKSAGLRTNMLVCLGSCLVMLISMAIYQGVEGRTNADPARLAAQVVSGIGFLGAGGGLATGGGYYTAALLTTGLVFVTLGALSRIDEWVLHDNHILLTVFTRDLPGQIVHINECLEDMSLTVHTVKTMRSHDSDHALVLEFELFNHAKVKGVALAEAVSRIEGVTGVNIA